jgi:hypothetical protein
MTLARLRKGDVDQYGAVRNGNKTIKRSQPIGTITVRKRKPGSNPRPYYARYIKVKLDGPCAKRWMLYARWWWEKNRGPVPPDHIVYHEDGNELNDDPKNLVLGTRGEKFVAAHKRDPKMSRENRQVIGKKLSDYNRMQGRINRATSFVKGYWYPVVDEMSVILNVPFRRRKRLLACFGVDVSQYPANGTGKHGYSEVQRALEASKVKTVRSHDLTQRQYMSYCLLEPASENCRGPMAVTVDRLIVQLDRMGIWKDAKKQAKRDMKERK